MIKLKTLISENEQISKINAEIERLYPIWRDMEFGDEKDALENKINSMGKERDRIRDEDPYEGDKHAFMKHHYTGYIASDAYANYEKRGGLAWLGPKSKYPKLLSSGKYGEFDVEFRQTGERLEYCKKDPNDEYGHLRDERGELLYMSPEEIRAEGLPEYETSVVAFVGDEPIGFASNEFGAVGVWVEKAFQGKGIGTELLDLHIQQRPTFKTKRGKIGQMTNAGISLTGKYYDKMLKRHGSEWFKKLRVDEND